MNIFGSIWKNFIFLGFLLFLSSCYARPVSDGLSGSGDNEEEKVGDVQCSRYREALLQYVEDGSLIRNKMFETVSSIRTSFKYESTWVRVPLILEDLNEDGLYELIYLLDVTSPNHKKTNFYILKSVGKDKANNLIEEQYKSEFYRPLMKYLEDSYKWRSRDFEVGAPKISLSGEMKNLTGRDDPLRFNLVAIEEEPYLLVEGIDSKNIWLLKFTGSQFEQKVLCVFEDLVN